MELLAFSLHVTCNLIMITICVTFGRGRGRVTIAVLLAALSMRLGGFLLGPFSISMTINIVLQHNGHGSSDGIGDVYHFIREKLNLHLLV